MAALRTWTLLAATALTCATQTARAGDPEHAFRLGVKGAFGFGGKAEAEADGFTGSIKDDLEPTVGFAVFGYYPLHRYFHIGLQTTFGWVIGEDSDNANMDRTTVIDISPVLKGRVPLLNDKLELYAIMPIGLTIAIPPSDATQFGTVDTGVGWNVGLQFGVSYLILDSLGVLFEMGWQGRGVTSGTAANVDVTTTMHQFAMNFGLFYAF